MEAKIACIGNMNNNNFAITRYLRDRGYNAKLLLLREFPHFMPDADSYKDHFTTYTSELDWYHQGHWNVKRQQIRKDLSDFNFFIGTDLAPAFLNKAGIKMDIFVPHGGDLFKQPFYRFEHFPPRKWEWGAYYEARQQKLGIKNAGCLCFEDSNPEMEQVINKLRKGRKWLKIAKPMIYLPQYSSPDFEKYRNSLDAFGKFKKLRAEFDLIIFHHVRLVWTKKKDQSWIHWKANDKLLKGFRDFIRLHPAIKTTLVLFEYGWDIKETKQLAGELGIDKHITWMPQMARKDIMTLMDLSDIGVGELEHSWLHYGAIYEFMAMGVPIIHYRKDSLYKNCYPELYPMYNASTPGEICNILSSWISNKEEFKKTGVKAQQWLKKYVIDIPLEEYENLIAEKFDKTQY